MLGTRLGGVFKKRRSRRDALIGVSRGSGVFLFISRRPHTRRIRPAYTDTNREPKGVLMMKIVVVKSPPILKPFLRRLFGISKKR